VSLLNALVTIGFGALAGGITNAVAIWMLFHPYESRGVRPFKLQGAIPKNKARLAKTIGRTVGQRLLTSEDLTRQLSAPGVREAFDGAVRKFVFAMLESERGSLSSDLPPGLLHELQQAIAEIAPRVADRASEFVASEAFRDAVERFLVRTRDELADRPIGEVLTAARRAAIRERVERWVGEAVASEGLDRTIHDWLDRQLARLAEDHTPLLERLPTGLVAALEKEIADYLPLALDRLAATLGDPASRARMQRALHDLFQRFVRDLLLHERIVARLVVTEKTVARLLDNFEQEGAENMARLLDEPKVRSQVARSINDAVVSFLRRPVGEHLQRLGPERIAGIRETAVSHVLALLRDAGTRSYAIEQLDHALEAAEQRTWGDLLRRLPPARTADLVAQAAQVPQVHTWVEEATAAALTALLDRPIGRPADWLPPGSVDRIASNLSPVLWSWIQQQVPTVVARVDVQTMVEHKVLGFSLERIEQIVRATSQRELNVIVRLGYLLGAIVGAIAYSVSLILS
jgi:uncharacterized membrane protein YheB (UPF0754 family)